MINMNGKKKFYLLLVLFQLFLIAVVFFSVNGLIAYGRAQATGNTLDYYKAGTAGMLGIAAGLSVGMAILGSGYALKTVGTSAIATLTEREEAFFKAFLVVALCEALAVYGLIIAILLWTKIPTPA
ncbi:MAG: ATP synthase subunit C [Candidatus Hermodarchaeota archaeon]